MWAKRARVISEAFVTFTTIPFWRAAWRLISF
jgi:hypothetical protein